MTKNRMNESIFGFSSMKKEKTLFGHILYSFYYYFVKILRVAAEIDIPAIGFCITFNVLVQLNSIFNGTNINHSQCYPILGF